jgi:lysophospholipase L1-like esterase
VRLLFARGGAPGEAVAVSNRLDLLVKRTFAWLAVGLVFTLLAGSLFLNVLLFRRAVDAYRAELECRLDPTGARAWDSAQSDLAPRRPGQTRVVLFGDSRVAQWTPPLDLPESQIVNRGVPGETTAQAMLRVGRDLIALEPDVVVIQVGINDLKAIGVLPAQRDAITERCARNIEAIVRQLREREIGVVVLSVFPVGPIPWMRRAVWSDETLSAIRRVNARLGRLEARDVAFVDCDSALARDGRLAAGLGRDELHLSPEGYVTLNRLLEPRLTAWLDSHRAVFSETTGDVVQ